MLKLPALALLALFPVAAALPAHARPYKDLCNQLEPIAKIAGMKYVKPTVRVEAKPGTPAPKSIVFTIDARAGIIRVTPAADGTIDFPLTKALCDENPNVESNQPPGTMSMAVSVDISAPPASSFDYRLLTDMRADWDEAVKRQGFMWRMMAPGARAGIVVFEAGKAASAEVRLPQGVRRIVANEKGELRIPFDEAWQASNPRIVLSDMPKKIGLAFKSE